MFLESNETGIIKEYGEKNFFGYCMNLTNNPYKETLNSFYSGGATYKGPNLLGNTSTSISSGDIEDAKIGTKDSHLTDDLKITVKITSQALDAGFVIDFQDTYRSDTSMGVIDWDGGPPTFVENTAYITVNSEDWDSTNKIFTLDFNLVDTDHVPIEGIKFNIAGNDEEDYITIKQYVVNSSTVDIIQPDFNNTSNLDCSDFASFLWAASKGNLIKEKIFDCEGLITEKFDFIESVEKISSNNVLVEKSSLEDVFNETENGDIYVFKAGTIYHCLTIVDAAEKLYTECSSYVSFFLDPIYNCTLNPYPFNSRVAVLMKDTIFYKVRLI